MVNLRKKFSKDIIKLDNVEETCEKIVHSIRTQVPQVLKRRGGVIGISGGIDSSVCFALTVKALGADNVLGLILPEKDSSPESATLAQTLADKFGVKTLTENITGALEGFNCYRRRDEAVARVFPEYNPTEYKMKIGIKSQSNRALPSLFSVVIIDKDGNEKSKLLPINEYLQIVASSNFKQRSRMSMLYYHAERLHYAVIGTPNKHEVEQGFFVKNGDSGADIMPIANLYKMQVYELAHYLGIPEDIIKRTPTSDTYSASQTQEEFFFQLPFQIMDLLWYGYENGYEPDEISTALDLPVTDVKLILTNFKRKQETTDYLRMAPLKIE